MIESVRGTCIWQLSLHSSTWRELEAVNRVLKSNISCLEIETVRVIHVSENKNVSNILRTDSKKRIAGDNVVQNTI